MIRVWVLPLTPQILFQMFDFYFHSWVDEVFSTYLKSEFWGLKLSSSRRAQTGVECVFLNWSGGSSMLFFLEEVKPFFSLKLR